MIGGGTCIAGHLRIADQVMIVGMAMITNSIQNQEFMLLEQDSKSSVSGAGVL